MTKPRAWLAFVLIVVAAGVAMCTRDLLHSEEPRRSSAEPLGVFSMDSPGLSRSHAHDALARDARRRESRFRNAADPGYIFSSTRVTEDELPTLPAATLYEIGAQLFHYRFTPADGFGDGSSGLQRIHRGARGGPDAYSCSECHRRGGIAGAGDASDNAYLEGDGDRPDAALERNPPALAGAGLVELLAREMTEELAKLRDRALAEAKSSGAQVDVPLSAKGIAFGSLVVSASGEIDARGIRGVSPDLVVRPFGHKGHAASLIEVVDDELRIHHGMQSARLLRSGDTARMGNGGELDPDGDGIRNEITDGQLGALTMFIAMQEVPEIDMPLRSDLMALWPQGETRFRELGCASCHVPSLPLDRTEYSLKLHGGGTVTVDLARVGSGPRMNTDGGPVRVQLFSDLKRHAMGASLRESRGYRGVLAAQFLTRPLWGVARSRPYLHDARAPTLDAAILAHGGEALAARDAYAALSDEERGPLRIYLTSLSRARRLAAP